MSRLATVRPGWVPPGRQGRPNTLRMGLAPKDAPVMWHDLLDGTWHVRVWQVDHDLDAMVFYGPCGTDYGGVLMDRYQGGRRWWPYVARQLADNGPLEDTAPAFTKELRAHKAGPHEADREIGWRVVGWRQLRAASRVSEENWDEDVPQTDVVELFRRVRSTPAGH